MRAGRLSTGVDCMSALMKLGLLPSVRYNLSGQGIDRAILGFPFFFIRTSGDAYGRCRIWGRLLRGSFFSSF